jgi:hypothetical protein
MTLSISRGSRAKGRSLGEPEFKPEDAAAKTQSATRTFAMASALSAKVPRPEQVAAAKIDSLLTRVATPAATQVPRPARKMTSALMEAQRRFNAQVRMLLDALVNLEGHELQVEEIFEICGNLSTAMMPLIDSDAPSDRLALFARHLDRNMSHLNKSQIVALRIGLKFVDTPQTQIECPYLTAIQGAAARRVRNAAPAGRRVETSTANRATHAP